MKKKCVIFLLLIILGLLIPQVFALVGISPPDAVDIDFKPGLERDFKFKAYGATATTKLLIRAEGELNSSITFDVSEINQTSSTHVFHAHLKIPDEIEKPGKNTIYISLQTVSSVPIGGIGTSEKALVPINIFVPYPGKYIEYSFRVDDVNLGEDLFFILEVINRGTRNLNEVYTTIELLDSDNIKLHTLQSEKIFLEKEKRNKFELKLNSSRLGGQGPYLARINIFYDGEIKTFEKKFRVGKLDVNLINHTKIFEKDQINTFDIVVESIWNSKINNIFAKVKIKDYEFQTPSKSLDKWQRRTLRGFWDTTNFEEGVYDAEITLFYENKSKTEISKVEIIKKFELKFNITTILIIILSLIIILDIIWFITRRKKKKVIKKKK